MPRSAPRPGSESRSVALANTRPLGFTIPDPPSIEDLSGCVQCGLCLNACPTFRELRVETESPRGRLYLMRALGEGRVEPTDTFTGHLDLCLACRACEAACPSGVRFGHLIEATRAELRQRRRAGLGQRLLRCLVFEQLFLHPGRLASLGRLLRAYQRSRLPKLFGRLLPPRLARAEALLPRLSGRFFRPEEVPTPCGSGRRAALFAGCVMRLAFADSQRATLRLMARAGLEPEAPDGQVCCGALHLHAGERELARELARRNVLAFERSSAESIVVNAAGCGATLKEYGQLLSHDPAYAERAGRFSARIRDLSELLAEHPVHPALAPAKVRVTYQDACHLAHAQRIRAQPRAVLRAQPGLELVEMASSDLCCGSAGLYSLTQPDMASRLLEAKVAAIAASGAEVVVSGNPGCLIQIQAGLRAAGLPIRAVHLADLLDELGQ